MVYQKDSRSFVQNNRSEIEAIVRSICYKNGVNWVDDVIQDIYLHIINSNMMSKYDKKKGSLSTFLYVAIINIIIVQKRSVHQKIMDNAIELPSNFSEPTDLVDAALSIYKMTPEHMNIVQQNRDSDDLDGIGFDLRMFVSSYLEKKDTLYRLHKRKNKKVNGGVCSMKTVYKYLFNGIPGHEIAAKYGVSSVFISSIKHDIAKALKRYGLENKSIKRRRNRGTN